MRSATDKTHGLRGIYAFFVGLICVTALRTLAKGDGLALSPPMGWNSYDCFDRDVTESDLIETAEVMAKRLKAYGYTYIVTDWDWYRDRDGNVHRDAKGRFIPAPDKYPHGFRYLADRIHELGLKFGVHYRSDAMPTNRRFLRKVAEQLDEWGVDFVKYDFVGNDIDRVINISKALSKCKRDILLSLSFKLPVEKAWCWEKYAHMTRMTDDVWDNWESILKNFAVILDWNRFRGPGHWPDCDMLPLGRLRGGRPSKLTRDEQMTMMTLWSVAHSPLFIGGDLRTLDDFTYGILTNPEVLEVNQQGLGVHAVGNSIFRPEPRLFVGYDFGAQNAHQVTEIRYCPRAGFAESLLGARFEGSNDGERWSRLCTVFLRPAEGRMTRRRIRRKARYRYVRLVPLPNRMLHLSEVQFVEDGIVLTGQTYAIGHAPKDAAFEKAFDGNLNTYAVCRPLRDYEMLKEKQVWWCDMPDGSKAVALFNLGTNVTTITVNFSDLGFDNRVSVRDLWRKRDLGTFDIRFETEVAPHGTAFLRMKNTR